MEKLLITTLTPTKEIEAFQIHPTQMPFLKNIQKGVFDFVEIRNTESSMLNHKNLSYIQRLLKPNSTCEIYIHQKITVIQDLEAQEIESNARLAKFSTIESSRYENYVMRNGVDIKESTIRLTLTTSG
jgi:hypothetical protein